jgi:hypothetical protein
MDSLPGGIAELTSAIQSASIQRHPDVRHDLDPGTAASGKIPVKLESHASDTIDGDSDLDEDEVPMNVLRPLPRRNTMPPLPDMRFEQSYLKSIESASGAPGVAYITIRDQVCHSSLPHCSLWKLIEMVLDNATSPPRLRLVSHRLWLATYERRIETLRRIVRSTDKKMVVGSQ